MMITIFKLKGKVKETVLTTVFCSAQKPVSLAGPDFRPENQNAG